MAEFNFFATGHVPGQIDKSFSSYGLNGNALATWYRCSAWPESFFDFGPVPTYLRRYLGPERPPL